jgi:RimJ/RimL family protein N-acetyltransferase
MSSPAATVVLEPVDLSHAPPLQILAGDPAIAATTRIAHPYPPGQAEKFIRVRMREREDGLSWVFAVKLAGEVVGVCGLLEITTQRMAEIGYWIGRPYWGRGLATLAVADTLRFSFGSMALRQVFAKCLADNHGSRRVLEKNRFRYAGTEPHHVPHWPATTPLLVYRVTGVAFFGE